MNQPTLLLKAGCLTMSRQLLVGLLIIISSAINYVKAQAIGTWNFNSSITGVAGPLNTVSVADFSGVGSTAFNASMEYYGHDGWPTGALNPGVYLQFTLTPNIGYALNINALNLRLRHSNTGSGGGSGPKQFTVRSSIDGYTSDIASGGVTAAYVTHAINPGAPVLGYIGPVTFRVYGYMSVLYSGGNNRFVFDNIEVSSIGVILPMKLHHFNVQSLPGKVELDYRLENSGKQTRILVERSDNGLDFETVSVKTHNSELVSYTYIDQVLPANTSQLHYRLKIEQQDGKIIYSRVQSVRIADQPGKLRATWRGSMLTVYGDLPANAIVSIYDGKGTRVHFTRLNSNGSGRSGSSQLPVSVPAGVYHIVIFNSAARQSLSVFHEQ